MIYHEIGVTEASGCYTDENFIGLWLRNWNIMEKGVVFMKLNTSTSAKARDLGR
jgi:hypothetical protein